MIGPATCPHYPPGALGPGGYYCPGCRALVDGTGHLETVGVGSRIAAGFQAAYHLLRAALWLAVAGVGLVFSYVVIRVLVG